MPSFDVLVVTPPSPADPSLAIAACRAGLRGFLDLEFAPDEPAALAAVERLERFTRTGFGVKLGRDAGSLVCRLAGSSPRLRWVILAGGLHPHLEEWIQLFHRHDLTVLLEAINLDEALAGERLGVDGLILKGHEAAGRVGTQTAFVLTQQWVSSKAVRGACPGHSPTTTLPFWVQGGIGLNAAAACLAAGAAGVVLDCQ
ncbi:MAG TPA: hypothetical protein VNK04_09985, partial [Gemmataceae bacterium]|nr:hypothetical protein [Gemmataceae bacterium]